jgi:HK97 family phage prohead protease
MIARNTFRVVKAKQATLRVQTSAPARKFARFDASIDISDSKAKTFDAIKDGDRVVDYQNVQVKGYLSTFGNTDRDGDVVQPGAFSETIPNFMRNPVILADHRNSVREQVGSFNVVREDAKGLYVEGVLSNADTELCKQVRSLVAEGHLKTMSMGGIFYYDQDGRTIFKVALFEGSLTPVPANPEAIFSIRECTELEAKQWQFAEVRNQVE